MCLPCVSALCAQLVEQVISQFFKDPEWIAAYDSSIPQTTADLLARMDDGSLWGGSEARRLASLFPEFLLPLNGAWELCLDLLQPHKSLSYSVGLLGLR